MVRLARQNVTVIIEEVIGNGDYIQVRYPDGRLRSVSRNCLYLSSAKPPSEQTDDISKSLLEVAGESSPLKQSETFDEELARVELNRLAENREMQDVFWAEMLKEGFLDSFSSLVGTIILWIISQCVHIQVWVGFALIGLCPVLWLTIRKHYFLDSLLKNVGICGENSYLQGINTLLVKLMSIALVFIVGYLFWALVYASRSSSPEDWYPFTYVSPKFGMNFGFSILWISLNYILGESVRRSIPATQGTCFQTLSDYLAKQSFYVLRLTLLWGFVIMVAILIDVLVLHFGLGGPRIAALVGSVIILLVPTAEWSESKWRWMTHGFGVFLSVFFCFLVLFMQRMSLFNLLKCIWALPYVFAFVNLRLEAPDQNKWKEMQGRCDAEIKTIKHLVDVLIVTNRSTYY